MILSPKERAHIAICAVYDVLDISNSRVEKALCKAIEEAERDILELAANELKKDEYGNGDELLWTWVEGWSLNPDFLRERK